jgi:hypothetical protein
MRNTFTLIAFVLLCLGGQAQLLRSDFPDAGDSQVYRRADSVAAGPSGAGQNWNFSGLVNQSTVATNQYITASTHPQGSFFPTANLCYKPFNDDFDFYRSNTDSLFLVGEKSPTNTRCNYTNGALLYSFPQAFNIPNMDSVEGIYPDGFISNVTRVGWYQTLFDGDGVLTTPVATYPSVKRVEISAHFQDSSWLGAADGEVFILRYEWYASTQKMPVLIIHNQQFILNGGNPSVTYEVWYADSNAVATTDGSFGNLELYPNPSQGNSRLTYHLDADDQVEVEVLSILGERVRIVASGIQAAGNHELELETASLAKGIYMVRFTSSQGSVTRKLVLN